MNTLTRQRGASLLSGMIILTMAGVILIAGIKLAPAYLEYYAIAEILEQMQSDPSLKGAQKGAVANAFNKRLNISQVYTLKRQDYKITKIKGKRGFLVAVDYEVRKPLFLNLSIVASFKRNAEVGG